MRILKFFLARVSRESCELANLTSFSTPSPSPHLHSNNFRKKFDAQVAVHLSWLSKKQA
jgi:hypothetical protein